MNGRRFRVTIPVIAPFMFAAAGIGRVGVDVECLRDGSGLPLLPGDHVRGHLRHAASALFANEPGFVRALFGETSAPRGLKAGEQDIPERGALLVGDFRVADKAMQAGTWLYHRVKLDDETGAAEDGALQVMALAAPPGQIVFFEGTIVFKATGGWEKQWCEATLRSLLTLCHAIGGQKSSGFGEIHHDGIVVATLDDAAFAAPPTAVQKMRSGQDRFEIDVAFDQAILVNAIRHATNVVTGQTVVPGGAIKGALAEALMAMIASKPSGFGIPAALSALHISHAWPLVDGKCADRALPLAYGLTFQTSAGAGAPEHDAKGALCFTQDHVRELAKTGPVVFQPDWKDEDLARRRFSRPTSKCFVTERGRVAIGEDGVAQEGQLFITRLVETDNRLWRLRLDFGQVDEATKSEFKTKVADILAGGLDGIGRTGARMTVRDARACPPVATASAGTVRIILETPAILTDTLENDAVWLAQYEAYFKAVLGSGVTDLKAVAQRRLAGDYYGFRFKPYADKSWYVPFEVTQAGACFEMTLDEKAAKALNNCLRHGLPPRIDGRVLEAEDWRLCPFMNQNGFGEISLLPEPNLQPVEVTAKVDSHAE